MRSAQLVYYATVHLDRSWKYRYVLTRDCAESWHECQDAYQCIVAYNTLSTTTVCLGCYLEYIVYNHYILVNFYNYC